MDIISFDRLSNISAGADKDLPDLIDAKKRLSKLKEMSIREIDFSTLHIHQSLPIPPQASLGNPQNQLLRHANLC